MSLFPVQEEQALNTITAAIFLQFPQSFHVTIPQGQHEASRPFETEMQFRFQLRPHLIPLVGELTLCHQQKQPKTTTIEANEKERKSIKKERKALSWMDATAELAPAQDAMLSNWKVRAHYHPAAQTSTGTPSAQDIHKCL